MLIRLDVVHDGRAKMCGKVLHAPARLVPYPAVGAVEQIGPLDAFLHHDRTGSQAHRNFDAPGGVDSAVLDQLLTWRVPEIHHLTHGGTMLVATPEDFVDHGIYDEHGGRNRYYLPFKSWLKIAPWYDPAAPEYYAGAVHVLQPMGRITRTVIVENQHPLPELEPAAPNLPIQQQSLLDVPYPSHWERERQYRR